MSKQKYRGCNELFSWDFDCHLVLSKLQLSWLLYSLILVFVHMQNPCSGISFYDKYFHWAYEVSEKWEVLRNIKCWCQCKKSKEIFSSSIFLRFYLWPLAVQRLKRLNTLCRELTDKNWLSEILNARPHLQTSIHKGKKASVEFHHIWQMQTWSKHYWDLLWQEIEYGLKSTF